MAADGSGGARGALDTLAGPEDPEAERAVLAAVLLDAGGELGAYWRAKALLRDAQDFAHPGHALLWECMGEVLASGADLDVLTLTEALRRRDRLNTVGGPQYVGELTDYIPTLAHVESHARLVAEAAVKRRLTRAGATLARRAAAGEPLPLLQTLAREALETAAAARAEDLVPIDVAVAEEKARFIADDATGVVTTGLRTLDAALAGGLWDAQLVVVGARPSVGKSALGLLMGVSAAEAFAARGEGVAVYVSVEMPRRSLAARGACLRVARAEPSRPIDLMAVRERRLGALDMQRYDRALDALNGLPLQFSERRDVRPSQVRALCLQARARYGRVGLVVVDYLQKMEPETPRDSREREVAETSRILAALAGELGCPVVALSQLNREASKRRPTMADLRESGAIEQDADVVLLLHREGARRDVTVEKQRDGATTDEPLALGWVAAGACFVDADNAGAARSDAPEVPADDNWQERGEAFE